MINVTLLAAILLLLRLISVFFLMWVLIVQVGLLMKNLRELSSTRKILFAIVTVTLAGNIVPIIIDTAALTGHYVRTQPPLLGVTYALSNATTSAISALGWWLMYKMIERETKSLHREHEARDA